MAEDTNRAKEHINWDEEKRAAVKGIAPGAKYGAASESLRHTIPEPRACAMFCKGKKCKYENAAPWSEEEMEIKGLYSNWITSNILAMARPNTENIEKYEHIKQFKENGISSIINLQLPGEHASCGNPLEDAGFSYKPQDFMDNDIFFYNFGWQDYGVGALSNILDMVKVMQFALFEGKVAIHCHAGLGRTGVLIACYLVYANRMDPGEVVHFIRSKRPPAIQTRSQIICIQEFAQYLQPLRVVYSSSLRGDPALHDFTLSQFLIRQKHILHGIESRKLKFAPKIIYECCENLVSLAGRGHHRHFRHDRLDDMLKTAPSAFNNVGVRSSRNLNHSNSSPAEKINPLKAKSVSLESFTAVNLKSRSSKSSMSISRSSSSTTCNSELSDSDSLYTPTPSGSEHDLEVRRSVSNGAVWEDTFGGKLTPESVASGMAVVDYSDNITDIVQTLKKSINDDPAHYRDLEKINDPRILAKLMWDWMDHLKEPVLHAQDLPHMLEYTSNPREGLNLLNKGAKHTIELIFKTIAKLDPLSDETEQAVVQRVLSTLTHQNMVVETDVLMSAEKGIIKRTSNDTGLMRGSVATKMMYFFMHLLHLLHTDVANEHNQSHHHDEKREKSHGRDVRKQQSSIVQPHRSTSDMGRRKSLEAEDALEYMKRESLNMRRAELEEEEDEDEGVESDEEDVVSPAKHGASKSGVDLRTYHSKLAGIQES